MLAIDSELTVAQALMGVKAQTPVLDADEVHVVALPLAEHLVEEMAPLLSTDECERAARFVFLRDRNHFVVARGFLRKFLGGYLNCDPRSLQFAYGAKGKPSLSIPDVNSIKFNLAHSHGLALYGFSWNRELGVDLEFVGRDLEYERLATRFFTADEVRELRSLSSELTRQGFFNCWTRKEAYIKARGEGLSIPLDEFNVSLRPGEPAALLNNYRDAAECSRWSMHALAIAAEYAAALVVEGKGPRIRLFCGDELCR